MKRKKGFIDIHAHGILNPVFPGFRTADPASEGGQPFCSPEELIGWYDRLGIDKGCILPEVSPESFSTTSTQTNEEMLRFCQTHPDRFIPFCCFDPRMCFNSVTTPFARIMTWYRERGYKGIGEITANMPIMDARVQALFSGAEEVGFSVTCQIAPFEGGNYGLVDEPGLPGLEETLKRHPKLKWFGHSQSFWCEIGEYTGQAVRFSYPVGKVKEGRLPKLMRRFPNLYGDLSAASGCNALSRDKDFGIRFMNEFQDRLLFGMDICRPWEVRSKLPQYLNGLLAEGAISQTVYDKIAFGNAERLLAEVK